MDWRRQWKHASFIPRSLLASFPGLDPHFLFFGFHKQKGKDLFTQVGVRSRDIFRGYPTNEDKISTTFCKEKKKSNAFPGPSSNLTLSLNHLGQQATSVEQCTLQPNQR